MSDQDDQIRQLQEEIRQLRQEVQGLKQQGAAGCLPSGPISRRGLLLGAGAAAGAAAAGLISSQSSPALAQTSTPVNLGQTNPAAGTEATTTGIAGGVLNGPTLQVTNFYGGANFGTFDNYSDAFQAYTYGQGVSAVYGRNDSSGGSAVEGLSTGGVALYAAGAGRILQDPNVSAGPPSYTPAGMEQVRDGKGGLWLNDSSGAWRRVNSLIPCMPFRVLDTRINVGAAGPVPFGSTISLSLVPSAVPLNTLGIAGNLTAVNPTSDGWLAIYPGGTPFNNVSNVNYSPTSDPYYAIANFVIVGLGPSGGVTILTNGLSGHVQVLLDIFGYIQ